MPHWQHVKFESDDKGGLSVHLLLYPGGILIDSVLVGELLVEVTLCHIEVVLLGG